MEEPIVRVEHLSHRYSVQWAIRDINFEINQKGILGLLGSNGAGKIRQALRKMGQTTMLWRRKLRISCLMNLTFRK